MTWNAIVSFHQLYFFSFSTSFLQPSSSVISDGHYCSLLQRRHEEILGYWSEAVLCLPSGFELGNDFVFLTALRSVEVTGFNQYVACNVFERKEKWPSQVWSETGSLSFIVKSKRCGLSHWSLLAEVTGEWPWGLRWEQPADHISTVLAQHWKN